MPTPRSPWVTKWSISLGVEQANNTFANKGTAFFTEGKTNKELNLSNMTPGDEARFTIQVTNNSNVTIQYRVKWIVDGELYDALTATVDGEALVNNTTAWAEWAIPANDAEKVKTFEVSVLLPTAVGNEFQNKNASIQFVVEAIQGNAIFDEVKSVDQLMLAMERGDNITLGADIALSDNTALTIAQDAVTTIDLAGYKLTGNREKSAGALIVNNGTLTILGTTGTLTNETANGAAVIENNGKLTIESGNIVGAPLVDGGYPKYPVISLGELIINNGSISGERGALSIEGGNAVINNGTFVVEDTADDVAVSRYTINCENAGTNVVINGGHFENKTTVSNGSAVVTPRGASISIYGGDFRDPQDDTYGNTDNIHQYMGYSAPVYVYGGTFSDASVKKFVAPDFYEAALDTATGIYTVQVKDEVLATDSATLGTAIANGSAFLGNDVQYSGSFNNDTVIGLNGNTFEATNTLPLGNNADLTM